MPDYRFELEGSMVTIRPKTGTSTPTLPGLFLRLKPETFDAARRLAQGWDIHGVEAEWRDWVTKKSITPHKADAHFLSFCKKRGKHSSLV